jgi:hypothetical protein
MLDVVYVDVVSILVCFIAIGLGQLLRLLLFHFQLGARRSVVVRYLRRLFNNNNI